jgi:hypothetical protein
MDRYIIQRKVGVGKNLFGSVSHKFLLDMLKEKFPENIVQATSCIITEIKGNHLYLCVYVCIYMYVDINAYIYIYVWTKYHTYIYTYIHIYR